MSKKTRVLVISLCVFVILSTVYPVYAASFDGTYNYAYNLNGPNGWEEHRVDGGFIVRTHSNHVLKLLPDGRIEWQKKINLLFGSQMFELDDGGFLVIDVVLFGAYLWHFDW